MPIVEDGRFRSPFPEFEDRFFTDVLRMALWIGHATSFVQVDGVGFLTDPIWSARCSPVSFAGPERYTPPPCALEEIMPFVRFCLISHGHYDHLDLPTVEAIGSRVTWITPLGLKEKLVSAGIDASRVVELNWWDEHEIAEESPVQGRVRLQITATPAQHWSNRTPFDRNTSLWCAFCVCARGSGAAYYFAGDTGYTRWYGHLGEEMGPFDLAALPIGAYAPRWFMRPQHTNPEEAVMMHQHIKARRSYGIHWGTFPLTIEPLYEPEQLLRAALQERGIGEDTFVTLRPGAIVEGVAS